MNNNKKAVKKTNGTIINIFFNKTNFLKNIKPTGLKMTEQVQFLKDQFPIIASKHPEVFAAQAKIELLLKNVEDQFELAS